MEKVFNISYDLRSPQKNYSELIVELEACEASWQYLPSSWLICTTESASQVWDRISSYFDVNDRILIIEIGRDFQGWLPSKAWQWIRQANRLVNQSADAYR